LQNQKIQDAKPDDLSNHFFLPGMQNPKIQDALSLMRSDPKKAKEKYEKDEQVNAYIKDFSGLMGRHFELIGKDEEKKAKENEQKEAEKKKKEGEEIKLEPVGPNEGKSKSSKAATKSSSSSSGDNIPDDGKFSRDFFEKKISAKILTKISGKKKAGGGMSGGFFNKKSGKGKKIPTTEDMAKAAKATNLTEKGKEVYTAKAAKATKPAERGEGDLIYVKLLVGFINRNS
jgi:hypothetical protein